MQFGPKFQEAPPNDEFLSESEQDRAKQHQTNRATKKMTGNNSGDNANYRSAMWKKCNSFTNAAIDMTLYATNINRQTPAPTTWAPTFEKLQLYRYCGVRGRALASLTGIRRFDSRGRDCLLLFADYKLRSHG